MSKKMKKLMVVIIIFILGITVTDLGYSGSRTCMLVKIEIKNLLECEVKVTQLKYYDEDSWEIRHERPWIPLKIAPGATKIRRRNLKYVRGDQTIVLIEVRKHLGGSNWGPPYWAWSEIFTCRNGCRVKILIKN